MCTSVFERTTIFSMDGMKLSLFLAMLWAYCLATTLSVSRRNDSDFLRKRNSPVPSEPFRLQNHPDDVQFTSQDRFLSTESINLSVIDTIPVDQPHPVVQLTFNVDNLHYGFTNQIILFGQLLELACSLKRYVIAPKVHLEIGTHAVGNISQFIDIEQTNQKLNCTKILPRDTAIKDSMDFTSMQLAIKYNWQLSPLLKKLVLADSLRWYPAEGKVIPAKYYGLHFRLEMDWIIWNSPNGQSYFKWLEILKTDTKQARALEDKLLNSVAGANQVFRMINCFKSLVPKVFNNTNLPIVLATGLGKNNIMNERVEWILPYFRMELQALGFTTIIGDGGSGLRELDAASEIKLMLDAEAFIGDRHSSFTKYIDNMRKVNGVADNRDGLTGPPYNCSACS